MSSDEFTCRGSVASAARRKYYFMLGDSNMLQNKTKHDTLQIFMTYDL